MSYTSGNSSKASTQEVKENQKTDIKMGFKVSGGFFKENKDKLLIQESQTINQSIPMFEIMEKSFGAYKKGKNAEGRDVIVTKSTKFVKDEKGKYTAIPKTRVAER